jgi:nitrate reductase gamma subunit
MYEFISGPLVWISFGILIAGAAWRLSRVAGMTHRDKVVLPYLSPRYATRSLAHWLVPYNTVNMRRRPGITAVSWIFHICLLATPLFLQAHVELFERTFGFAWFHLPGGWADAMTAAVLGGLVFFVLRRLADPATRYVTDWKDFALIGLIALPFATGLLARYQIFPYRITLTVHIVTGCVALAAIPFTRLVHMVFFPLSRAYMASEFGFRHARDW